MKARIALTLAPWSTDPLPTVLDVLAGAGYGGALIEENHLQPWRDELGRFRDLWEEREIHIAACSVAGSWQEQAHLQDELERLRPMAELLAELECEHAVLSLPVRRELVLVAGYQNLRQPFALTESRLQYLGEALNVIAEVLLDVGIKPSIRNRLGTQLETAEELHQLMDTTEPELVSLTLDVGQAMVAGTHPEALVRQYASRIGLLICKDIDLTILKETRDDLYDYDEFLHRGGIVPLGQGHIDFMQVLLPMMSSLMAGDWLVIDPQGPQLGPVESAETRREYLQE
ncbi:MAG: hypothetical protein CL878_11660, partial [Dehalococcoidia bacterium]|nr:hypothetical protein [Dehalococcoidia bacterium]